ncbi:hypothetical protein DS808_03150 [Salmonella enterica]|nr:hypothetical protein [Salmonella enterica]
MTDQATPNLPSRDFDSTAAFYERLGFGIVFRDAGWMILQRGDLMLEFFAHPSFKSALKFLYFLENRNFGIGIPKLIRLTIGRPKEDIHMKEDHPKLNY